MYELLINTLVILILVYSFFLSYVNIQAAGTIFSPLFLFIVGSLLFINSGYLVYFNKYIDETWALQAVLSTSVGVFLVSIGGFLASKVLKTQISRAVNINNNIEDAIPYGIAFFTALIVYSIVLLYFYFLGYIPIVEGIRKLFSGGFVRGLVNTFRLGRDVYVNPEASYIPMQGFMEVMRYCGLPIVGVWFLHFYRKNVHKKLSIWMFITSALLIVSSGQRWPLMYFILTLFIYWSRTLINKKRLRKTLINYGLGSVVTGTIMSALLGRTDSNGLTIVQMLNMGFNNLIQRIFVGNVEVPFQSYSIFYNQENLIYGRSYIQNFLAYLPGPLPSYPVTFYQLVTGDPIGYTAPPDFYTEAFINFGWIGWIFICFFWGWFLVWLQIVFIKCSKSLLGLSITSLITTLIVFSVMSGVVFILGGLIVSLFIFTIVYVLKTLFTKKKLHGGTDNFKIAGLVKGDVYQV